MPSSTPDDLDPVVLTAELAAIDSVNPALVEGAAGERAVGAFIAEWCVRRGLEVHVEEVVPGRSNVVVVRRGSGGGRSVILNGHLDTVGATGPATMAVRIEPDHPDGGRLVGRGVLDTKGGLACALVALARVSAHALRGDVIVAAVIDEEHGSLGTDALVCRWQADAAIVLEPTSLAVCPDHRGFAVIDVDLHGVTAHTSRPDRGANAAHAAAEVMRAVIDLDEQWAAGGVPIGERPLTLVNRVVSRSETFTVPARCDLTVEVRTTADGPDLQIAAVRAVIDDAVGLVGGVTGTTAVTMARPPLGIDHDHPLVSALRAALTASAPAAPAGQDEPGRIEAAPFWTDAALHAASGTAAVVFGPAGQGLHEDLEWVTLGSLHHAADALTAFLLDWCA